MVDMLLFNALDLKFNPKFIGIRLNSEGIGRHLRPKSKFIESEAKSRQIGVTFNLIEQKSRRIARMSCLCTQTSLVGKYLNKFELFNKFIYL